jgi:non-ribosomal peptide synthetase-like protein
LWSTFIWRNELLNALHEHLAEPFLVGALTGTPFVCWYFRLLGAHIGKRVYMETTDFSEFDLARIGDEAALNADCTIQTHLFEDRVMKMSTVKIGPRSKVGAGSLVLYDTRIEEGAALGDLSLLMKGEVLPAGTRWEGIPARRGAPDRLPPIDRKPG